MSQASVAPRAEVASRAGLRWWTEIPLLLAVYGIYSAGRLLVRGDISDAVGHGLDILKIEKVLHINLEHPLNRLFTREAWLGIPADFWYASLHYLVTPAILVWLFRTRSGRYGAARTWLMTSTFIGLIGFTLLPTCPPRLLHASFGFADTMREYSSYGWWGGDASAPRGLGGMTNQYAAMPSLHVGWALWCGVMLWRQGGTRAAKVVGVAYPLITAIVVMGTANHYLLDTVAGVAVMGAGLLLTPYVLRCSLRLRTTLRDALPATLRARLERRFPVTGTAVVSGGCQTAGRERIPRQPESRSDDAVDRVRGAEPDAAAADTRPSGGATGSVETVGKPH